MTKREFLLTIPIQYHSWTSDEDKEKYQYIKYQVKYQNIKYIRLTTTFHLTLMMTSAQVVETSVTTTNNSPSQDYSHPDNQTTLLGDC